MAGKKRLLIVSGSFPKISCGVSGHVELIARLTAARGQYDVHVLTANDPAIDVSVAKGYHVYPRIKKWSPCRANAICSEILKLSPDIVHIQSPTIKYYGLNGVTMSVVAPLLKLRAPKIKLVAMQHDIAVGNPIMRWRYHPLFNACDAIFISNSRDEQAIITQGISRSKIYRTPVSSHFAPPACDTAAKQQARDELQIADDERLIAYFGYIHPGRNIDTLVRAIALLAARGLKIRAIIMGGAFKGQEQYYKACKQLAKELNLGEQILWTGFASHGQIAQGMAVADVFVSLPARGADMRNTSIITAMLAKLPIVTTRNRKYYVDLDLQALGCRTISTITATTIADAIEAELSNPRDEQAMQEIADKLNPDKIWQRHINVHHQAYCSRFNANSI